MKLVYQNVIRLLVAGLLLALATGFAWKLGAKDLGSPRLPIPDIF